MKVINTSFPEVKIIEPKVIGDERGFFMETWQKQRYIEAGVCETGTFVQDNLSYSKKNVIRGLHYQYKNTQEKLIYVLQGSVFNVVVDIRRDSANYGKWVGVELTSENKRQLYVPKGFANGFCITSDTVLFAYKCTDIYNPQCEISIKWDDPAIGIEWPVSSPILSDKDIHARPLADVSSEYIAKYK